MPMEPATRASHQSADTTTAGGGNGAASAEPPAHAGSGPNATRTDTAAGAMAANTSPTQPTPSHTAGSSGGDAGQAGAPSTAMPQASHATMPDISDSSAAGDAGAVNAGAVDAGAVMENPTSAFDACVAALQPMCQYDEKETPCSSLITTSIPLSDGGTWGNNEIKGGPYGAFVEWNQGEDFANPVNASESTCSLLAASFGEPADVTADVLELRGGDLSLYTIFRPACMKDGETYPVITWGNGTCGQSGGYAALLATLASHGFVVIAANSRFTDAGNDEMLRALDLAKALNEAPDSALYGKLNLDRIGAMGHSQGASATAHAAADPRIKAVILWNGGLTADKPFLAVSGDRDITGYTPEQMEAAVQDSSQPGAYLYYHQVLETGGNVTGHLTLMEQPERVWEPTVAWWQYMLNGDETAKAMFVGADCGLCGAADAFEFGANSSLP